MHLQPRRTELLNPPVAGSALTSLLGFSDRARFLETHWERQPVVARAGLRGDPASLLDPAGFAALSSTPSVGVSVVAQGVARPVLQESRPAALFDAYADGCTLLATEIEKACPPVAELCRAVELEFLGLGVPLAAAASGNAFLTPTRSRGFDLHYDNHCAFVLQLHGQKRWELFAPLDVLPLARCEEVIPRTRAGAPVLEATLSAGDVLYIPRGFPHWARSTDVSSLHVTLSLRTVTWADMVGDLARTSAALRRSLPPAERGPGDDDGFLREQLVAEADRWVLRDYRERRVARTLVNLRPLPTDPVASLDAVAVTGLDTPLTRADTASCVATQEADAAVLSFPGWELRLPREMAPVLGFVARTASFRPRDLPEIDADYDRLDVAQRLVTRGLLVAARGEASEAPTLLGAPAAVARDSPNDVSAGASSGDGSLGAAGTRERDLTLLRPGGEGPGRHLDWLRAQQPLTNPECDAIIAASLAFPPADPTTVGEDRHPGRRQVLARQIGVNDDTRWFLELMLDLAAEASAAHYGLRLSGITRPPQYLEYRPGQGRFERHNDYSHDQADSPRKLTVIIQLSEPADYDGGRLHIHGIETEDLPAERGTILLFPSFLYHSVSPITRGVRRALVCWVAGPRLT